MHSFPQSPMEPSDNSPVETASAEAPVTPVQDTIEWRKSLAIVADKLEEVLKPGWADKFARLSGEQKWISKRAEMKKVIQECIKLVHETRSKMYKPLQ